MRRLGPHRELDEVDFQIIIQLCLGKSQDAAGDWVCTPEFPAGISGRTVRKRIDIKRAAYDRLRERIGPALQKKQEEFEEVTKQHYLEKLGRLRSKGYLVKEKALDNAINGQGDMALGVKVADGIEDRDFGRVSQVHKLEGGFNVNHTVTHLPARTVIELARALEDSRQLLPAPQSVIDAEYEDSQSASSTNASAASTDANADADDSYADSGDADTNADDDDDADFPSVPIVATPAFIEELEHADE